jgi:hypothetical protein
MPISPTTFADGLRADSDLSRIAGRLAEVADSRFDVVAPQRALRAKAPVGRITVDLGTPQITNTGVTAPVIHCQFTRTAWRQLAERLRIPLQYLDRLIEMENPIGPTLAATSISDLSWADERRALYRFVETADGMVLRAILSDKYRPFDNDVALQAILGGFQAHGLGLGDCEVTGDVTPDRMRLRITVPQVELAVPHLLGNYRMPYSLRPGAGLHDAPAQGETPPVLWAGVEVANSETGMGAFTIAPRAVVAVCKNGLTRAIDFRRTHLGATLEDGTIDWSDTTREAALTLITSQVTDAVATYISPGYLQDIAASMERAKDTPVGVTVDAVDTVQQSFGLTTDERNAVFELFAACGDHSVLGLANAVTATAQLASDGDRQSELEQSFWAIVEQPVRYQASPA